MRGKVIISPADVVPDDGSLLDPVHGRFVASWQEPDRVIEEIELEGAEAAVAWGRARAEVVCIRLGHRGDTWFSAGDVAPGGDDEPMPPWPPDGPPASGWWLPPES